jgi:recombinational DNA repair ATPase RecF
VQRELSGEVQIKIAGKPARSIAQLVEQFPLQVISADSFGLLTGAPGGRRQYLDWGVFHVEHRFFGEWQRFQRCIKQRTIRSYLFGHEISLLPALRLANTERPISNCLHPGSKLL